MNTKNRRDGKCPKEREGIFTQIPYCYQMPPTNESWFCFLSCDAANIGFEFSLIPLATLKYGEIICPDLDFHVSNLIPLLHPPAYGVSPKYPVH